MNLSPFQKEIILKLRNGWQLGRYTRYSGGCWRIQKGGLGRGGETLSVKTPTAEILFESKLIEHAEGLCPVSKYQLTELGKTINID